MRAKGREWRRIANKVVRIMWGKGDKGNAHLLLREVIKDGESEENRNDSM